MQPEDENGEKKKKWRLAGWGGQQHASKMIFLLRPAAVVMLEWRNRLPSLAHLHVYSEPPVLSKPRLH